MTNTDYYIDKKRLLEVAQNKLDTFTQMRNQIIERKHANQTNSGTSSGSGSGNSTTSSSNNNNNNNNSVISTNYIYNSKISPQHQSATQLTAQLRANNVSAYTSSSGGAATNAFGLDNNNQLLAGFDYAAANQLNANLFHPPVNVQYANIIPNHGQVYQYQQQQQQSFNSTNYNGHNQLAASMADNKASQITELVSYCKKISSKENENTRVSPPTKTTTTTTAATSRKSPPRHHATKEERRPTPPTRQPSDVAELEWRQQPPSSSSRGKSGKAADQLEWRARPPGSDTYPKVQEKLNQVVHFWHSLSTHI